MKTRILSFIDECVMCVVEQLKFCGLTFYLNPEIRLASGEN